MHRCLLCRCLELMLRHRPLTRARCQLSNMRARDRSCQCLSFLTSKRHWSRNRRKQPSHWSDWRIQFMSRTSLTSERVWWTLTVSSSLATTDLSITMRCKSNSNRESYKLKGLRSLTHRISLIFHLSTSINITLTSTAPITNTRSTWWRKTPGKRLDKW